MSILSFGVVCVIITMYNKNDILKVNLSAFEYIIVLIIIYIGTLWHEFGHFTSCYKYGITPKNIGFGLYIVFPVLFSDVTSIWLLSRKKRMVVNYAGIYFQLIYIVLLFCISFFIGKTILLKAAYIIIISFISTLNPILRFDGYWLFSDAIGVDNLREKQDK
jgi:putative peptide zinc metalloprotease protein